MASDPLELVKRFCALAVSTEHEEEARTSALNAVRLVHKHGMRIVSREDGARLDVINTAAASFPFSPQMPKTDGDPESMSGDWRPIPDPPRIIVSKRDGRCKGCNRRYFDGDRVVFVPGAVGCWCRDCKKVE